MKVLRMVDDRIQRALEVAVDRGEVGVQVAAYRGEDLIVDASIGVAEEGGDRPAGDAIFPVFSVTKAALVTALLLQVERGILDLDAPIASYWPGYGQNGKGTITARHVLNHRGGVPHMPPDITPAGLFDWEAIVQYVASVTPIGPPSERSVYHALSFGYILGELLRITDPLHRMPCAFIRQELLEPIGADEFWIGLPADLESRVARLTWGAAGPQMQVAPSELKTLAMPPAIAGIPDVFNQPAVHQACMPAANGIAHARSGARLFSLLANGGTLGGRKYVSESLLRKCLEPRANPLEIDAYTGMATWVGIGGFWLGGAHPPADAVVGASRTILAHGGAGGTIAWADLDTRLSVMITHNRMFGAVSFEDHPFVPLGDAIRAVAAE